MISNVDRSAVDGQGGFAGGFGHRRVGVAGAGDVFGTAAELHHDHCLGDHFRGSGAQDVHA